MEPIIRNRTDRAKAIMQAGISLGLAELGVKQYTKEDPNRAYITFRRSNGTYPLFYTDGKTESKCKEDGALSVTVSDASWVAIESGRHVDLYTILDKDMAACSICGWMRKIGGIKRLAWPVFSIVRAS